MFSVAASGGVAFVVLVLSASYGPFIGAPDRAEVEALVPRGPVSLFEESLQLSCPASSSEPSQSAPVPASLLVESPVESSTGHVGSALALAGTAASALAGARVRRRLRGKQPAQAERDCSPTRDVGTQTSPFEIAPSRSATSTTSAISSALTCSDVLPAGARVKHGKRA